jgi:hypothetical protein
MSLAWAYKRKEATNGSKGKGVNRPSTTMAKGGALGTVAKVATPNRSCFKWLMTEELVAKRTNRECYNCPQNSPTTSARPRACSYWS